MLAIALGLIIVMALTAGALYFAGVFKSSARSSGSSPQAGPSTGPAGPSSTSSGSSGTVSAAVETYSGGAFSINYPSGWTVKYAEQQHSWGTDTTIVSPTNSNTLLRVDVSPHVSATDPLAEARPEVNQLSSQPGYRQLDLSSGTFQGHPAEHWEFVIDESGVLLHKEDEFFTDSRGDGVAILTQAPANDYSGLAKEFSTLRQSLSLH